MPFASHRAASSVRQAATLACWRWRTGFASATPLAVPRVLPTVPTSASGAKVHCQPPIPASQATQRLASSSPASADKFARRVAFSLASLAAVPGLMVAGVVAAQAWVGQAHSPEFWATRLELMLRPAVSDAAGLPLGFVPPTVPGDLEAAFAADPGQVPEHCIDMALAREDEHHASWLRYFQGVDLGGVMRAAITGTGGASTIPMQIARQLAPEWARQRHAGSVRCLKPARQRRCLTSTATTLVRQIGRASCRERVYSSV